MNFVTYVKGNIFAIELKGRRVYSKGCANREKHGIGQHAMPCPF